MFFVWQLKNTGEMPGIGQLNTAAFLAGMRGLLTREAESSTVHMDAVKANVQALSSSILAALMLQMCMLRNFS